MQKTLIALSVFVALSSTSLAAEISKNADVVAEALPVFLPQFRLLKKAPRLSW